jgi:GTP pyrophosphokinase
MNIDLEAEKKEILKRYRKLLAEAKRSRDDVDKKQIRKAFDVALEAHKEMRRKSGEPYIYHPIAVAQIVAEEIGLGTTSIVAALLHDTVEDTEITLEDIDNMFGSKVCIIIDGLTKISGVIDHSDPNCSIQAENFRKMMLSLSDDVRVILVKLADRLHNMRTMEFMPRHKQLKISYETLYIYAPLAHRLGLNAIKTELENLAFQYTETDLYDEITSKLKSEQKKLTRFINKFSLPIINSLTDKDFDFEISGRPKSPYSIARKMKSKNIPFEEVYDVFAIRIVLNSDITNEKVDCWNTYSTVTDMYTPRPDRLRDWVSTPKTNGYESLHTTVMGPEGKWVEVQIRTKRMHEIAEKGLAAHWKYKANNDPDASSKVDEWIHKIRGLLDNPGNTAIDFIDDIKLNLFSDEIYVFTPDGKLKTLPKGSTALDFAYDIHSTIGDTCIGAKVNHKLVPLNYTIKSGEQLEILTSGKQKPKDDWIQLVTTAKAKHGIKNGIKRDRKRLAENGKERYEKIISDLESDKYPNLLAELIKFFDIPNVSELYIRIDQKTIERSHIKNYLDQRTAHKKKSGEDVNDTIEITAESFKKGEVLVLGEDADKIDYSISPCCNPIPGDEVFGFITVGDGVKIHKTNCPNAMHLQANFAYRTIKAIWEDKSANEFLTGVRFTGTDDFGLVAKIVNMISGESKLHIKSIQFDTDHNVFEGKVMLYVKDNIQLLDLQDKLKEIEGVHGIKRVHTN